MANTWSKLHHDILVDPKTMMLPKDALGVYVLVLALKGSGALDQDFPPGLSLDCYVARRLDLPGKGARAVKERLMDALLIDEAWQPLGWANRQTIVESQAASAQDGASRRERDRLRLRQWRLRSKGQAAPAEGGGRGNETPHETPLKRAETQGETHMKRSETRLDKDKEEETEKETEEETKKEKQIGKGGVGEKPPGAVFSPPPLPAQPAPATANDSADGNAAAAAAAPPALCVDDFFVDEGVETPEPAPQPVQAAAHGHALLDALFAGDGVRQEAACAQRAADSAADTSTDKRSGSGAPEPPEPASADDAHGQVPSALDAAAARALQSLPEIESEAPPEQPQPLPSQEQPMTSTETCHSGETTAAPTSAAAPKKAPSAKAASAKAARVAKKASAAAQGRELSFAQWRASLGGALLLKEDDPIFERMGREGIPPDWVFAAWLEFGERFAPDEGKKQRNWLQAFRNYVRNNWLRLWAMGRDGQWFLTAAGVVAMSSLRRIAAPEGAGDEGAAPEAPAPATALGPQDAQRWKQTRLNLHGALGSFEKTGRTRSEQRRQRQVLRRSLERGAAAMPAVAASPLAALARLSVQQAVARVCKEAALA